MSMVPALRLDRPSFRSAGLAASDAGRLWLFSQSGNAAFIQRERSPRTFLKRLRHPGLSGLFGHTNVSRTIIDTRVLNRGGHGVQMNKSVYVSSTYQDLKEHREAVHRVLAKMRYNVRAMEDYVARDNRMVDQVLRDVAECDIYLGIFAWRYGYVPPQGNPAGLSVTELEYREAEVKRKPRLVFLVDADAPWSPKFMDSRTGENEQGARIGRLRERLTERMYSPFTTPEDLAVQAAAAVHLAEVDAKAQALSNDLSSASCLTMNSSETPEIITNIRRAVTEDIKADVIKVNLGTGKSWWSTRLHLLSALCADYTEVRQFLLEAEGYRFLGMCTPSRARRALAQAFPDVEEAYRESVLSPKEMSFNPVEDVSSIVDRFSAALDRLGGEPKVMKWVEPHLIENWPGVSKDCIDLPGGVVTSSLLESVVRRHTPFVVLVRDGIVQEVVDRAALATRMAIVAP